MGHQQRSRIRLPTDTRCYLCGNAILPDEEWDRDHVPPKRIFALAVLQEHSPNLEWLYAHKACNRSYREDEEYFVVSFAGHVKTATASAVMNDIRRGAAKGHLGRLIKDVLSRFGKVIGPTGERVYTWDSPRVERALWKIFRFNAMAMLFWDGLIVATIFHDPTCECGACRPQGQPVASV